MLQWLFSLWLCPLVLLFMQACGDVKPIRIGLVAPLTRFSTELGMQGRDGAILAVEEVNAQGGIGGRKLQLEIRDVGGGPDSCERILHELLGSGHRYLIGPFTSNMAKASLRAMHGSGGLMITPTMSSDVLDGQDDEILRIQPSNSVQAQNIVDYMLGHHLDSVAVLYDASNREYTQSLADSFSLYFLRGKGTIIAYDSLVPGLREPSVAGTHLGLLRSPAYFMVTTGANLAILSQNIIHSHPKAQLFAASWGMTPEVIEQGGRTVEGMIFSAPAPPPGSLSGTNDFEVRFLKRFSHAPSFAAVASYEGVRALAWALREGKAEDPLAVRRLLLSLPRVEGVYSDFHWNSSGDVIRPQSLVQIRQGAFVKLEQTQ